MATEVSRLFRANLNKIWKSESGALIDGITDFEKRFPTMQPESFTAKSVREYFSNYVDDEISSAFTTTLMGLYRFIDENNESIDKVEEILNDAKEDENQYNDNYYNAFNSHLVSLLDSDILSFIYKGSKLYYEINDTPGVIELLTEIRPVFSNEADNMDAYIIRSVLHIKTISILSREESEFSLSREQILDLRDKCDRALKKMEVARRTLKDISRNGVATFGEGYEN